MGRFCPSITIMPIDILSGKGGTELAAVIAEKKMMHVRPSTIWLLRLHYSGLPASFSQSLILSGHKAGWW